jgi:hypothetical protein
MGTLSMAAMRQPPRHVSIGAAAFVIILLFVFLTPRGSHIDLPQFSSLSSSSGVVGGISGGAATVATSSSSHKQAERLYGKDYKGHSSPADINRVANETLGFSRVFVIGLPERTDKRDAITLTSSLTGFQVDFIDGVKGESVPDKAVPYGTDRKTLWENNLGSWRGHMNAVRRYV